MPPYEHYSASIFNNMVNSKYIIENNYYYNGAFKNNSIIYNEKFEKKNLDYYLNK
jgi:hypothetical protein